jgi:uncharacterized lipoprotein YmbA
MVTMVLSPALLGNENNKIKKVKVLENTRFDGCPYSGNVVLRVKYRVKTEQGADINLTTSDDGINYFPALTQFVEQGRGRIVLELDAGECTQDIKVSI